MVLQQQYRNNKYTKYYELVNMLLGVEAYNELLMQNYQKRPVDAAAIQKHRQTSHLRGRGSSRGRDRGRRIIRGRQGELLRSPHIMAAAVAATMVVAEAKAKATPEGRCKWLKACWQRMFQVQV
jgi:hypothetical protein